MTSKDEDEKFMTTLGLVIMAKAQIGISHWRFPHDKSWGYFKPEEMAST